MVAAVRWTKLQNKFCLKRKILARLVVSVVLRESHYPSWRKLRIAPFRQSAERVLVERFTVRVAVHDVEVAGHVVQPRKDLVMCSAVPEFGRYGRQRMSDFGAVTVLVHDTTQSAAVINLVNP